MEWMDWMDWMLISGPWRHWSLVVAVGDQTTELFTLSSRVQYPAICCEFSASDQRISLPLATGNTVQSTKSLPH